MATDFRKVILDSINTRGAKTPWVIGFRDGTSIAGIPTGVGLVGGLETVTFLDTNNATQVSKPMAEITSIST